MNNVKMAKGLEINTNTERVNIENNIVSGSTEKCEQLLNIQDVPETNKNGVAYFSCNGAITLNGTANANFEILIPFTQVTLSNNMYYKVFASDGFIGEVNLSNWTGLNTVKLSVTSTNTGIAVNSTSNVKYIRFWIVKDRVYNNSIVKPMLVEGSTAPTTFQPYFTGLRYGYYKGLQLDKFSYIDKTNNIKHNGGVIEDLETLDWKYDESNKRFYVNPYFKAKTARTLYMLCSKYKVLCNGESFSINLDKVIYNGAIGELFIHDHDYTDVNTFKNNLNRVMINYGSYTPIETNIEEF